jgi:MICOS complex subunit MIC10
MPETSAPAAAPTSVVTRPVSEALLNEKVGLSAGPRSIRCIERHAFGGQKSGLTYETYQWDRCLSNLIIKSTLGVGFGVVFSVLLFKRRAWPAFVGFGFGAGRAYEECNYSLKQAARDIKKA